MDLRPPNLVLDDLIPGCEHFIWREVLYLKQWRICVYPEQKEVYNLISIVQKLDWIRKYFNSPIKVTSGLRPKIYNQIIGGAFASAHMTGEALDFQVKDKTADQVRASLIPLLKRLEIRMEDLPGSNWVHIDLKLVGKHQARFFKP